MKKQVFLFLILSGLLLTGCGGNNGGGNSGKGNEGGVEDLGTKDFHTDLMKDYLADTWDSILTYVPQVTADKGTATGTNLGDVSQPKAIKLEFDEVADADNYVVQIAKNAEFTDAKEVEVTNKYYDFYNSELGQEYYFRAAVSEDALAQAKVRKFKVNDAAPRNIHVDGVINFRDVGGWSSSLVAGAKVKQGLYYRCAQFDDQYNKSKINITADGKKAIEELGIKLDIDMRDSNNVPSTSPAKSDDWNVDILKASVASGTENTRWEGGSSSDRKIAATYKDIFEHIAVANENPIALHCTHGADRTGIVSWFLLGLLGVSKEDCARDYVMTRFAGERSVLPVDSAKGDSEIAKWNSKTEALQGATWAEKTYNHLHNDFNIEIDTLETIRELFIPGYTRPAVA